MKPVIKGSAYVLAHVPEMVIYNGTTQTTERVVNPESEYLKEIRKHLRKYEDVLAYAPNQCYIGGITPEELKEVEFPWYDKQIETNGRYNKFGEIMPEEEFLLLMQVVDEFDLVFLDKEFVAKVRPQFEKWELVTDLMKGRLKEGHELSEIEHLVNDEHAEGLYHEDKLVGCVRRAHDIDQNLNAHVMHENMVSKASSVLALAHVVKNSDLPVEDIEYVIDCSEEACGDMNQRGGGNFAKAAAEIVNLPSASGSDTRSFCAAPSHALVEAAALVKAGVFKAVAVTAGGSTAKLGMNGKDHVKRDLPILEDCLGGFAIVIAQDDGVNPIIDLDHVGRHAVGTGSAPQAVISALVTDPLDKAGLSVLDVDKFSPEMQNPDITKPAGAGDVPLANFKMIAALAVKRGELDRKDLNKFTEEHGLPGFAPTQGHIPSGAPYIGHASEALRNGEMKRVMIIGKGSLFLGRMTNLFDGISFMLVKNDGQGESETAGVSKAEIRKLIGESLRSFAEGILQKEE
ncbi:MAG: glycine/sarcosine/betaine reductase complex component C subunit beta [Eubacteriales bacterium]|nr:glycine/sarcosine/betaine reductase complex component C subunit beta [Eubacteriales bacterium]